MLNLQLCSPFRHSRLLKNKKSISLSYVNSIYHYLVTWAQRCFKRPDNDVCMACSSGNKKKISDPPVLWALVEAGKKHAEDLNIYVLI